MTNSTINHVNRLAKEADRLVADDDDFSAISFFLMIRALVEDNPNEAWDREFLSEVDKKYTACSARDDDDD